MKVNNVIKNARNYPWMVVRFVDGEWWYYGSWTDVEKAVRMAADIGGAVVPSDVVVVES